MGRNCPPATLITEVESPEVTSSERKASVGVGVGGGVGLGLGDGLGDGLGVAGVGDGDGELDGLGGGVAAVSKSHAGTTKTRIRSERMKRGNDSRADFVTPAATGSTTPSSARESATADPVPREGAVSGLAPRPG